MLSHFAKGAKTLKDRIMMAIMRKLINNKGYKIIVWALLGMMIAGSGIFMQVGEEKKWVIKAYNELLSPERFDNIVKMERAAAEQYRARGILLAGKNADRDAVKGSLATLLSEHVLRGLHVATPSYVIEGEMRKFLSGLPPQFFRPNGELDEELFARAIAPQKMDSFFDNLRIEIEGNLLSSIVNLSSYNPMFELGMQYAVEYAQKDYSVIKFPLSVYVKKAKESHPSNDVLEKFYKKSKNNESFKTPEQRAGAVWKFTKEMYNITITENDIKKEYEKNKAVYLERPAQMQLRLLLVANQPGEEEATRNRADVLYKEAEQNPEKFEKMVKDFSEDKNLEKSHGLTKLFTQDSGDLDKAVINTAFESLFTDGQISTPIQTARGYEIVQRVKKVPARYKELASVAGDIKDALVAAKFKQRFSQDANRVISGAKYNPEALQAFVAKGCKSTIALTTNTGGAELTRLFKLEDGKYAVFFDKEEGVIVQCTAIQKSKVPALFDVQEGVLEKYYREEAKMLLEKDVLRALKAVSEGKEMREVAKDFGVKVESAHVVFKNEKKEQSPILQNSVVQSKLKHLSSKGALTTALSDEDGYVIRLDFVADLEKEELIKEKDRFAKVALYAKKYTVKEGFIASLYRTATLNNKIDVKKELLQQTKEV